MSFKAPGGIIKTENKTLSPRETLSNKRQKYNALSMQNEIKI